MEVQPEPTADAQPSSAPAPVMDVVAPPPSNLAHTSPVDHPAEAETKPEPDAKMPAKHPAQPKQPSSGVGLAIFATVVIVIALAALATYAYLKQTGKL